MMVRKMLIGLFILIPLLIVACGQADSPADMAKPQISTEVPRGKSLAAWEVEWNELVSRARKEGQVNIASAMGVTGVRETVGGPLKAKFGIEMELTIMSPAEMAQKLNSERKAGIYMRDLYIGGSSTILSVMKPGGYIEPIVPNLILPEIRNPAVYWNNELPLTADGRAISIVKDVNIPILINTTLVKEEELKSYRDLLNPKWKGKILMDDPTTAGSGQKWVSYILVENIVGGESFIKDFIAQEPVFTRDRRLLTEWVAHGKYAIAICARPEMVKPFKDIGAPVKLITPIEGTYVTHGGQAITLLNNPSHPNAAKVFLNWIFTKEANEAWSRAADVQSSRVDVNADFLDPDKLRKPGIKYFDSDNDDFMVKLTDIAQPKIKTLFTPLLK